MKYSYQLILKKGYPRRGILRPSELIGMRDNSRRGLRKTWLRAFRGLRAYSYVRGREVSIQRPRRNSVTRALCLGRQEKDLSHQPHDFLKVVALRVETPDNSRENWKAYHRRYGFSGLARFRVKDESGQCLWPMCPAQFSNSQDGYVHA